MKHYIILCAAICFLLVGILLAAGYVYEVWTVLGKDDQSVVFWYLPILFLGFGAFTIGGWLYKREHRK